MGAVFSIFDHIILPTHSAEIFEHLKVWNKMKCDDECHLCDEVGEFAAHAQEVFWSSNFWSAIRVTVVVGALALAFCCVSVTAAICCRVCLAANTSWNAVSKDDMQAANVDEDNMWRTSRDDQALVCKGSINTVTVELNKFHI